MSDRPMQDVLDDMANHTINNPTHGFDCACKDKFISELITTVLEWPGRKREMSLFAARWARR